MDLDEYCAVSTYCYLKPYLDEMWIENLEMEPVSLEAFYQHKGSGLSYSYAVLESTITVWKAYRKLEAALRNQIA
jgi:hypothetical protein